MQVSRTGQRGGGDTRSKTATSPVSVAAPGCPGRRTPASVRTKLPASPRNMASAGPDHRPAPRSDRRWPPPAVRCPRRRSAPGPTPAPAGPVARPADDRAGGRGRVPPANAPGTGRGHAARPASGRPRSRALPAPVPTRAPVGQHIPRAAAGLRSLDDAGLFHRPQPLAEQGRRDPRDAVLDVGEPDRTKRQELPNDEEIQRSPIRSSPRATAQYCR